MNKRPTFVEAEKVKVSSQNAGIKSSSNPLNKLLANLFILGVPAVVIYLAYIKGILSPIMRDIFLFFGGKPEAIVPGGFFSFSAIGSLTLIACLDLYLSVFLAETTHYFIGKPKGKNNVRKLLHKMIRDGNFISGLLQGVVIEEIIARWFFLSVLILLLPNGTLSLYFLVVSSSMFFAGIHLPNFEEKADRHWVRVLPQFFGGLILCFVYMKFGLLGAILTHFTENIICLTTERISSGI